MRVRDNQIAALRKTSIQVMMLLTLLVFLSIPDGFSDYTFQSLSQVHVAPSKGINQQSSDSQRGRTRLESMIVARETSGSLFDNVASVLLKKYYDERFRSNDLPKLISQFAERAKQTKELRDQRELVEEFLSHIPASHLGLLSRQTHHYIALDLEGQLYPTFGFQLMNINGKFYAAFILEGGPAQRAGLLTWDRVVSIDGQPVERSPRLDWRSDDAYIKDDRDPPVHYLSAAKDDSIQIKVERSKNKFVQLTVRADDYSAFAAAKASAQIFQRGGRNLAYLHIWYVHLTGVPELLKQKIEGEFKDCDALVLDLRGRGGNGAAISKIVDILRKANESKHLPIVALFDRQSRSAKDVLAYEFKRTGIARLVGEPTAGAAIPASFADVGYDTILMFPSFKLPRYTDLLELKPVQPDVYVERPGPLSGGADTILEAGLAEALRMVKAQSK
ncbi:MAG TPA: S41 family peptidase [Blastocatellia bacterium]|nr:S41 family peptidase [Blastocatellia bacterium]